MFINLNVRSHYSLLLSTLSIDDIIDYALKNNQQYVCLTDFNNLSGAVEFFDLAKKHHLKPIIGLEIYEHNLASNLILIAKNNDGYKNLIKISSFIMLNQTFTLTDFLQDVAVIVKDGTFNVKNTEIYFANSNSEKGIAINEVNCANKDDAYLLNVLQAIKNDRVIDDELALYDLTEDNWFKSEAEAIQIFTPIQLKNLEKLVTSCQWDLTKFHTQLIQFPTPKQIPSQLYLQSLCVEGLKQRFDKQLIPKKYETRLKEELSIINQMGYDDYFLIVYDLINFAKRNQIIIGPGRGSAVGSLVAYVLQITDVDPLKYDLIFERFLNPKRQTMPDIDIDIMDTRREEVVDYLFNKYGRDHVAHIVTFQRIKAKMAIRDVGRILAIPIKEVDEISKLIGSQYDENLQEAINNSKKLSDKTLIYPTLFKIAQRLINIPRQIGTHAAGIVLSSIALVDILPVQLGINNNPLSQFSMEHLERFGLLKMDLLGLRNLTIIDQVIKNVKTTRKIDIVLDKIPLDDAKTFALLGSGDTNGIFQLESPGMRSTLMKMNPKNIEDISITSSLYRPGPQENIPIFIERRNKLKKVEYVSDALIPILKNTNGIIVYQEQIIQIAQDVAGFSLAQADLFRRAISKKNESGFDELKKSFIDGAMNNNLKLQDAEQIFNYIHQFANYGFNHSHAIAYSLIGYWLAYLKTNYFLEFVTVLLSANASSSEKIETYVSEIKRKGIEVLPPDLNHSQASFSIFENKILFGFDTIKNIGHETIKKILSARALIPQKKFHNYLETIPFLLEKKVSIKVIESLIYAGGLDCLGLDRKTMINNLKKAATLNDLKRNMLFAGGIEIEIEKFPMSLDDVEEFAEKQAKTIGIYLQDHPFKKIKETIQGYTFTDLHTFKNTSQETSQFGKIFVKINSIRKKITKAGKEMAVVNVEDDTDTARITIWPGNFVAIKDLLKTNLICLISVKSNDTNYNNNKDYIWLRLVAIYNENLKKLVLIKGEDNEK